MAERLQISTATLRRLERGDPSLSMGTLAKALLVLNALERFFRLLDTCADSLGLQLIDEALPKRIVRASSQRGPKGSMRTDAVTQTMQVCLGEQAIPVGTLRLYESELPCDDGVEHPCRKKPG
jgi:transcriptional regulator with XRE-family HTH domain